MTAISDTTPIIALLKSGHIHLLEKMFGMIHIPPAVFQELTSNKSFAQECETVVACHFIKVTSVRNMESVTILRHNTGLDEGESEAIILAREMHADLLLMDERKGRKVAASMNIAVAGTIGLLAQAYDEEMLARNDVLNCISLMRSGNLRVSETLYQLLLRHLGL